MDIWSEIKKFKGCAFKTLDQGKPFTILDVNESHVIIFPHKTGKERPIDRKEIEGAYRELTVLGKISRSKIEESHSARNPAYVAAILAHLPGIRSSTNPIMLHKN